MSCASRSAAASAHSTPPTLRAPAIVAVVPAVMSVRALAPAPANPSRMPAGAMIPSFATRVHDRSDSRSVTDAPTLRVAQTTEIDGRELSAVQRSFSILVPLRVVELNPVRGHPCTVDHGSPSCALPASGASLEHRLPLQQETRRWRDRARDASGPRAGVCDPYSIALVQRLVHRGLRSRSFRSHPSPTSRRSSHEGQMGVGLARIPTRRPVLRTWYDFGVETSDTRYTRSGDVHVAYRVFGEGP